MAAAIALSGSGLSVALFDEQAHAGGQIYRKSKTNSALEQDRQVTKHGNALITKFLQTEIAYFPETFVWYVDGPSLIAVKQKQKVHKTSCRFLLVATGAQERPVAFKGWQLPGVMGVGAAQILLKQAGAVPDKPPVLFGSGPLLYLYASQLISAGVVPQAMLDTTQLQHQLRSLKYLPQATSMTLLKGIQMLHRIRKAGVKIIPQVEQVSAFGSNRLERIEYISKGKTSHIDTSILLSHHGVIPETRLLQTINAQCSWDESGQCFRPVLNTWGECSVAGVYVAGDVAGITGAISAEYTAKIAAADMLYRCAVISQQQRNKQSQGVRKLLRRDKKIRPFLESRYRVPASLLIPQQAAMVCRCEGVTAKEISAAIKLGCSGPNQLKAFTRCGMGACQGRMCGPTVEAMLSDATGRSRADVARFRGRAPVRPVSLDTLASLHNSEPPDAKSVL